MKISAEIEKVATIGKIPIEMLGLEQAESIKNTIFQKYTNKRKSSFLWESFADCSVVNNKDGWILITDYVEERDCLMFFEYGDDNSVIKINGGQDLYQLLSEMYAFEFYITNLETEYVICFNHHDCLIGCGTAKNWISKK